MSISKRQIAEYYRFQEEKLKNFIEKKYFPKEINSPEGYTYNDAVAVLRTLGFEVTGNDETGTFLIVKFPERWKLVQIKGSCNWAYLIDNIGQKRAAIFYKYTDDKNRPTCFVNYMSKYRIFLDHLCPYNPFGKNSDRHYQSPLIGKVINAKDEILYKTDMVPIKAKYFGKKNTNYFAEEKAIREVLFNECTTWLNERYPDNLNVFAYWDEEDVKQEKV